jgi:hypothetical protein
MQQKTENLHFKPALKAKKHDVKNSPKREKSKYFSLIRLNGVNELRRNLGTSLQLALTLLKKEISNTDGGC